MKKIIFFIFFIFFISMVGAVSPFQQAEGTEEGLTLRFPPVETVKIGRDVTSHMHVYNSTNGLILSNTTVDCFVDVYNSTGTALFELEMDFDENEVDFVLEILGGNFTIRERQSFIIWCNSTTAGGFVSGSFDVTPSGQILTTGTAMIYLMMAIIVLIFLMLSLYFGLIIPMENIKNNDGETIKINWKKYSKIFAWAMAYVWYLALLFILWNLSWGFLEWDQIGTFFYYWFRLSMIGGMLVVPGLFVWAVVYYINDKKINEFIKKMGMPYVNEK